MSEYGLIYYRVLVEIKWLLWLSQIPKVTEVSNFSEEAKSYLQEVIDEFSISDAIEIKNIEKETNHDVKAVEYFLKQKCQSNAEVAKVLEFFHFACTSEDINNLAHAFMLKEAMHEVIFPVKDELIKAICNMARDNAHIPMLSRSHGQPASPTTLGKEMAIFAVRLSRERKELSEVDILGKFADAVGNDKAHFAAYPDVYKEDIELETGEYFLSEKKKSAKIWQEKQEKQAQKVAENKRKREEAFIPPKEPTNQEDKSEDANKDVSAMVMSLKKKAKELRKRKSEENINAEAYIAGSAEEQVSRKKSKKQRS